MKKVERKHAWNMGTVCQHEAVAKLERKHYKATKLIARLKEALIEASTSQDAQRIATDGLCQYLGYRDHRNDPGYVMNIEVAANAELAVFKPLVQMVPVTCIHGKPWNADCADCQAEATAAANADVRFQRAYFPMKEWRNDRKKDGQCTLKELFEYNPYEEHKKRLEDRASICPHGADLRYFGCFKCSCQESEDMARQCGQDDKSEDQTNDEHKGPYPDW